MTFHWCPHTGHSMLEARYVVYWETSEAWPNCCACCNLVWHAFSMLLFPPWGLLVVLQHGAFGSTHYLQLFRVFLKIKLFLKTLPGGPTYTIFFWNRASVRNLASFSFLKGWTATCSFKNLGEAVTISPSEPSVVWKGFETPTPPPPLHTMGISVMG